MLLLVVGDHMFPLFRIEQCQCLLLGVRSVESSSRLGSSYKPANVYMDKPLLSAGA